MRSTIRNFLEKRRLRKVLRRFVSPDAVESILRDGAQRHPNKHGRIEFVVAFARGESLDEVSERVAQVTNIAIGHGAMVHNLVGALVIVAFGTHPKSPSDSGSRSSLVQALRDQLAGDVKIVHGPADGNYGTVGSNTLMAYTFYVPQFDSVLGTLGRLKFGESEEFTQ